MRSHTFIRSVIGIAYLIATSAVYADVDTLITVVDRTTASGSNSLAAFGYDPAHNTMYVSTFGGGGQLRRINNVFGGTQTVDVMVTETQLQLYYRDGNPDRGVSTPLQSGIHLNPLPVGSQPAYSFAMITDSGFTRFPATTTTDPSVTKRVYTYSLQPIPAASPTPPPYGDGRDVFSTVVTLAEMQTVVGTTSTTSNSGRQGAWSGDGQSYYFVDTSTVFGGVWKTDLATGTPQRLLNESDFNTEPAVLTSGGVDSIFFGGGGSTGNVGGIDKISYNGTTATSRSVHLAGATLANFLETTTTDISILAMASDTSDNLYFNNTDSSPERRGIFRMDPQGRLSKVVSYAERKDEFTPPLTPTQNPNSNTLRMQPTTVNYAGSEGSFPVTLVMYSEQTPTNLVAGAYAFEPGDFNRDNALDADDIALFKPQLTTRGVLETVVSDLKFDLNGNSAIDWKDVKILQQFADFGNGDIDLNGVVDMADYSILQANWLTAGKTYIQGDLSGDDLVNLDDYNLWAGSAGFRSSVLTGAPFVGAMPGDFDQDLDVDGADFVYWQTHFPTAAGAVLGQGDADGDGDIDGADFVVWQTNFPTTIIGPPGSPGVAPVPEPAAAGLAIIGFACAAALQMGRRKRS